jgi:hypothetical protein
LHSAAWAKDACNILLSFIKSKTTLQNSLDVS